MDKLAAIQEELTGAMEFLVDTRDSDDAVLRALSEAIGLLQDLEDSSPAAADLLEATRDLHASIEDGTVGAPVASLQQLIYKADALMGV